MTPPLVELCGVARIYRRGRTGERFAALDRVDLALEPGETLAIAGESGAGKSTLARIVLGLESPDAGSVLVQGRPLAELTGTALRTWRRRAQLVPQDPLASLDPALPVGVSLAEPLLAHRIGDRHSRRRRVEELLRSVGIPPAAASRRPSAFSGGQRQRLALARALAPDPDLLVLDEPVSALDEPLRSRILDLIAELVTTRNLTALLVSHEIEPIRQLASRTAVLYRGAVVEEGPTGTLLERPRHPYTARLLAAAAGKAPDPAAPVTLVPSGGCRLLGSCPRETPACRQEPPLRPLTGGHRVACWNPLPPQ